MTARLIGVVADTHGLLRPELVDALQDVDRIVHAGDVGKKEILDALKAIAPVTAVRGNMDKERWASRLRYTETVEVDDILIYVIHDLANLDLNPAAAGIRVVVSGHSHVPARDERDGVLYLNPGSAGPCRSRLPVTMAFLEIEGDRVETRFVKLVQ
ncbi:MAG: metallophosphoesterase family protein [Anaerolineae bacterium]|nr:metallophosphoesterase family protein [Anaerolineae bacterium]